MVLVGVGGRGGREPVCGAVVVIELLPALSSLVAWCPVFVCACMCMCVCVHLLRYQGTWSRSYKKCSAETYILSG